LGFVSEIIIKGSCPAPARQHLRVLVLSSFSIDLVQ
jgi:hypothetical protein